MVRNRVVPLIDGDMLLYQVAFGVQYKDEDGEVVVPPFDKCVELLDQLLSEICEEVWATDPPVIYLSADEELIHSLNKTNKKLGKESLIFEPNYREEVATTKPYKGNRVSEKPYHYRNLMNYIPNAYDYKLAIGMEADDLLGIDHSADKDYTTVLCSRDKDLRMIPGDFYSWPCHKSVGERFHIDEFGWLNEPKRNKLTGAGLKFFYSQLLTGDTVDNIPGLKGAGPVKAYETLKNCETEETLFKNVAFEYEALLGEDYREYLREQADLLWICREATPEGEPVKYTMWDERP